VAVGILRSTITFLPQVAGQPSQFSIKVQLSFPIQAQDTITFSLPEFFGPTSSHLKIRSNTAHNGFEARFNGSWSNSTKFLTLTALENIGVREIVTIIDIENGLRLPLQGLPTQANLTISCFSTGHGSHGVIPLTEFQTFGGES